MLTDDFERKGGHLKSVANEQGDIGISEVTNESFNEAATAGEILQSPQEIIESKVDELHRSLDILGVANPSDKEVTVFGGFHESWEKKSCNGKLLYFQTFQHAFSNTVFSFRAVKLLSYDHELMGSSRGNGLQ
ncbi:hypothetical protein P3S68_025040 [Capsicum galapagoense]